MAISCFTTSRPFALRTLRLRLFLLTLVSLKFPEVLRCRCAGQAATLVFRPLDLDDLGAESTQPTGGPWSGPHPAEVHHANICQRMSSRRCVTHVRTPKSTSCRSTLPSFSLA